MSERSVAFIQGLVASLNELATQWREALRTCSEEECVRADVAFHLLFDFQEGYEGRIGANIDRFVRTLFAKQVQALYPPRDPQMDRSCFEKKFYERAYGPEAQSQYNAFFSDIEKVQERRRDLAYAYWNRAELPFRCTQILEKAHPLICAAGISRHAWQYRSVPGDLNSPHAEFGQRTGIQVVQELFGYSVRSRCFEVVQFSEEERAQIRACFQSIRAIESLACRHEQAFRDLLALSVKAGAGSEVFWAEGQERMISTCSQAYLDAAQKVYDRSWFMRAEALNVSQQQEMEQLLQERQSHD